MREQQWNAFFDSVRSSFGRLNQRQVDGLKFLVDRGLDHGLSTSQLAYALATVWHETAKTMQPIEEFGKGRGHPYGKIDPETGYAYYARGYVGLTWRNNYRKADQKLGTRMEYDPRIALQPEVSAKVLFLGMMEGWFSEGNTLPKYVNGNADFRNARKVVNGLDRADLIAGYARRFQGALDAAHARPGPSPRPIPPGPLPPKPGESQIGQRIMPIIAAIVLLAVVGFIVWRVLS